MRRRSRIGVLAAIAVAAAGCGHARTGWQDPAEFGGRYPAAAVILLQIGRLDVATRLDNLNLGYRSHAAVLNVPYGIHTVTLTSRTWVYPSAVEIKLTPRQRFATIRVKDGLVEAAPARIVVSGPWYAWERR